MHNVSVSEIFFVALEFGDTYSSVHLSLAHSLFAQLSICQVLLYNFQNLQADSAHLDSILLKGLLDPGTF